MQEAIEMDIDMFVARHAVSWGNEGTGEDGSIHQGQNPNDPGLAPHGLLQAECMAHFLKQYPISGIVASPLPRAFDCAKIIQETHPNFVPILVDLDLMEISNGELDGWSFRKIAQQHPEVLVRWSNKEMDVPLHPGGETLRSVAERTANALIRAATICARSKLYPHYDGHPVVVSHGASLGLAFARLNGVPLQRFYDVFHLDNASISILHWDDAHSLLTVRKWNITSYLGKLKYSPEIKL